MRFRLILILLSFLFLKDSFANRTIDSLQNIIHTTTNDSVKAATYVNLFYNILNDPEKSLELVSEMTKFCETITNETTKAFCLRKIGALYHKLDYFDKALEYTFKSAALFEKLNDKIGLANCYNNIGNSYNAKGELTKDLIFYDRAVEYHLKCIDLRSTCKDSTQLHNSYNNIGNAYMSKKDFKKALEYYEKAYPVYTRFKDGNGIDMVMLNLGDAYLGMALKERKPEYFNKSFFYFQNRLATFDDASPTERSVTALTRIGQILYETGDIKQSIEYLQKAIKFSDIIKNKTATLDASEHMAKAYERAGDFKKANEYLHLYNAAKDSLLNQKNRSSVEQMQALFQSSQKDKEIEKLNTDKEIQDAKLNRQRVVIASSIGGFLLVLILVFVLWSRFNLKKKANLQLTDAYSKIELKNQQITDSINYAKRIQNAILPPDEELNKHFKNFFVFYAPRDIVSGDFYWFSKVASRSYFVVADCTGHGVPGALMSMIGNTLLNEIINQKNVFDPGEILYHLNKGVTIALHQQENDILTQDDGMDISVCCIDEGDKTKLRYASANHSIFVKHENEVSELKGDIFSIGGNIGGSHKQFITYEAELKPNSFLIMSSDGYYDQFGGAKDRKFLVSKFEKLIESIDFEKANASEKFKTAFEDWKGIQRQTDDILVAGFKI